MRETTFALIACVLFSGCGTIVSKSRKQWGVPYSGARCSWSVLVDAAGPDRTKWVLVPFIAADAALSGAADAILTPVDLYVYDYDEDKGPACGKNGKGTQQ